jgi:hypothetical protein
MDARRGIAALTLALAVSGCSGSDGKPTTLPPLTSTPTATQTADPSVPPFPATKQGAADFVNAWVRAANHAHLTGDSSLLTELSAADCRPCSSLIDSIREIWSAGSAEGGASRASFVTTGLISEASASVTATLDAGTTRIYDQAHRLIRTVPAVKGGALIFDLRRVGRGWQLADYRRASS